MLSCPDWSRPLPRSLTIPTVVELKTLADVRELVDKHARAVPPQATWRHVSAQIAKAADGEKDLLENCVSLRLVLALKDEIMGHQADEETNDPLFADVRNFFTWLQKPLGRLSADGPRDHAGDLTACFAIQQRHEAKGILAPCRWLPLSTRSLALHERPLRRRYLSTRLGSRQNGFSITCSYLPRRTYLQELSQPRRHTWHMDLGGAAGHVLRIATGVGVVVV